MHIAAVLLKLSVEPIDGSQGQRTIETPESRVTSSFQLHCALLYCGARTVAVPVRPSTVQSLLPQCTERSLLRTLPILPIFECVRHALLGAALLRYSYGQRR